MTQYKGGGHLPLVPHSTMKVATVIMVLVTRNLAACLQGTLKRQLANRSALGGKQFEAVHLDMMLKKHKPDFISWWLTTLILALEEASESLGFKATLV